MTPASGGVKSLNGTWSTPAATGSGTAGHYRIKQGATAHIQGNVGMATTINTSAITAIGSNVLTFASTTGVAAGQNVNGANIPAGATVISTTATTVTLTHAIVVTQVASGTAVTFGGDMTLDNTNIAIGQAVSVATFTLIEGNA
jgi:hypothetical protein